MARVDVLELKSFQKISLNEVSYINEFDLKKNQLSKTADSPKKAAKPAKLEIDLKSRFKALLASLKSTLHNILYETVPLCDTYSPE
jgi:hypothetical protein